MSSQDPGPGREGKLPTNSLPGINSAKLHRKDSEVIERQGTMDKALISHHFLEIPHRPANMCKTTFQKRRDKREQELEESSFAIYCWTAVHGLHGDVVY